MARGERAKGGCGQRYGTAAGLAVGGLLCLGFGLVLLLTVPGLLRQQVMKNIQIAPDGAMYSLWKDLPLPFFLSFYFLEVTNSKEVLLGAKPVLTQRGPYVYREYRHKKNITFHNNDTVSFLGYRSFNFQPDRSNGSESDYIVMPNVLVLGAAVILEKMPFPLRFTFSSALAVFGQNAFMNRTVEDIIWGYHEPFIQFLSSLGVTVGPFSDKFGLLANLNNSHSGLFTVFTGVGDITKAHMVDSWNGLKKVSFWHSDQCNMINGTAGEQWPPFMTPSSPVELYTPDVCRSIKLNYTMSRKFRGIPVYHYTAPKNLFANGTTYPPNEGFCPCRQSGIQNISSCQSNAPVFISQPHFFNADPALLDTVEGLHPNKKDHDLFVDIHPLTGIPMNCSVKMQMNLFIKHIPGIWQTGQIKPVVLPMIWFAESGELVGDILDDFYTHLIILPLLLEYLKYCLMGLGGLLLIAAGSFGLRTKEKSFLFWRSNKNSAPREAIPASRKKASLQWMEMK
ncbi:scavenger receptor class B member 1 isoform X2 [Crotalus tigris]|uniref:scavenger receptor class B member 1 isoform X2 n=1 Tax=Crotalus tigris TaxID=88082 RepID=UPI00192F5813|nr:scavenger receptor class B member 1 isoform X2 [Crotalus tigris]